MKEAIGHHIFNSIFYSGIIAYILYINFATYYNATPKSLNTIINVFSNWVFRLFYLLIVGFFALDIFKYGGFTLAILLTIAFLNSNMLIHKSNVNESFTNNIENYLDSEENNSEENIESFNNINGIHPSESLGAPLDEEIATQNQPINEINPIEQEIPEQLTNNNPNENCGPYTNVNNKPFNPSAYRADYGSLGSSMPDSLPIDQPYNGVFTQSSTGYNFDN